MSMLKGLGVVDAIKQPEVRVKSREIIGYAPSTESSALRPFRPDGRVLKSELPQVSNEQWTDFVFTMKSQQRNDVSPSNGLGMFDMRYKRLADLGLVTNVRYKFDPIIKRSVQIADWTGSLTRVDPVTHQQTQTARTKDEFLLSAADQYDVFVRSMRAYAREIAVGKIRIPVGVSVSGALAILHRGGRAALDKWQEQQFPETRDLFLRTNGVF